MADNTTLTPGSGGDVIRTVAKTATSAKTQVVALDLGGGLDNSPESIVGGGSMPVSDSGAIITGAAMPAGGSGLTGWLSAIWKLLTGGVAARAVSYATDTIDPINITQAFRDPFDTFTPGTNWTVAVAGNDILNLDGNAAGAGYLVLSLDPLAEATMSSITGAFSMIMPIEGSVGVSLSQRVLGNEFAVELVSTDAAVTAYSDVAIASIQQTTTTLSATTAAAHGLSVGNAISIYGVPDSRFNYPSLVVASVPSPTQFTATAGPAGTIASVTAGPYTQGFVTARPRLGLAQSGSSMIFENATVTNASFYSRSNSGDAIPSGTLVGSHSATCSTTASTQLVNSAYSFAFSPASEFRFALMTDKLQWSDSPVDSSAQASARYTRTQVIPANAKNYTLRFRASNNRSTTRPVAKIVSAVKTGANTATITTDAPHGLTVADFLAIYGMSDQTNFANSTSGAAFVASVIDATHFTVAFGLSVTATAYGGFIARVNGSNVPASFIGQAAISATLAVALDGVKALTLTGNVAWTSLSIGDYVNVHGLRNTTNGGDIGCDGAWRVRNVSTTLLELGPVGSTSPPAVFGATACGGAIIKRSDLRVSFVRVFEFDRLRVEVLARPANELASSVPVSIQGGTVNTVTTVSTVTTVAAITAANLNIPGSIADVASAALTTTTTTAAITPTFGTAYEVFIAVTAVSGTTPTMDFQVQESEDGTNWFAVYDFPRMTANGAYRSPLLPLKGKFIRYVQTLAGTTPSFTRTVNRMQSSLTPSALRKMLDRTITLTTLNSTTASLDVSDCRSLQLAINIGAATTPPGLQLQGSDDNGASWYALGSPLAAVASSTVSLTVAGVNAQLARAIVSTAGSAVTAGYVMIKGF